MPYSQHSDKPYNKCIACEHIGKHCDGPNFLAMSADRRSEWMQLRKEYLHSQEPDKWTNTYIAEESGVSQVTVTRALSGDMKDMRISTIENILKVLVNGTWGKYPCAMAAPAETVYVESPELVKRAEESAAECSRLREQIETMRAEHKAELTAAHAGDETRIDYLKEQIRFKEERIREQDKLLQERHDFMVEKDKEIKNKGRTIKLLAILLGVTVFIIILALLVDRFNGDLGYFWRAAFDGSAITSRVKL